MEDERATSAVLCAVDKQQARMVFNYCKANFACRR
jgi:hypothetical protein